MLGLALCVCATLFSTSLFSTPLFSAPFSASAPLPQAAAPDERPRIVLVTVDTLRREQLGCYGYPRPTSPRIDALTAESMVFERAFSAIATTFPSHLTMLTGLYPHQHGHTSNQGAVRRPYEPEAGKLSAAGALAAAGYGTAAFVSSVVLSERTGIGAGFATYDAPRVKDGKRSGQETVDHALAWLASAPKDQPFFLWVHLWDVHEPNTPEPRFAELLAPDDTLRRWVAGRKIDPLLLAKTFGGKRAIGERFFALAPEAAPEAGARGPRGPRRLADKADKVEFTIDSEAVVSLHARYDACVRQADEQVGRLIDALVADGNWPRSAFVVCGDHGQSLGDGQRLGHGVNTQVNVSVPLVIHFPAGTVAPGRSSALVSLVDLMPTLLAALHLSGLEEFQKQFKGANVLAPGFARDRILTAEATEFHRAAKRPYECAVLTKRWKYVRVEGAAGRLYDLSAAGEDADVAAANPSVVAELDAILTQELASSVLSAGGTEPVDPEREELLKRLKNLGYGGDDDDG